MATSLKLVLLLALFIVFTPYLDAARPLGVKKEQGSVMGVERVPSLETNFVLNALPKGNIPPSGPSKRVNSEVLEEELFGMHVENIDRNLQSVPSPGNGH
ncbi:hypothetical protein MRB53_015629 [Persea americana]|uniref:Uncharacterized protein n=1 Tax=Persea americana TaxID=3435 RepID=A0ACC2LZV9_PERAE|nr:hypothetical protein MRB53_015629 [Persea americana]|eukprot:TRINITY_DN3240_c0_g4_i1.p2 TRINITY_DN3240_c0_g4~~TRINITY_DN3240_c0_g4_i1.p2  ORF type:complete len:100 (+),score=22.75 TRINITY_DN3240_c0_g4_i1:214-513(+)